MISIECSDEADISPSHPRAEKHGRGQDQRDALEGAIGARRRLRRGGLAFRQGSGALSSLAAAAGGGFTVWLERWKKSNLMILKNANRRRSTRHDSGMPICTGRDGPQQQQFVKNVTPRCAQSCLQHRQAARLRSARKRRVERCDLGCASVRSPAAAFSAACSALDALGIANTDGVRVRKAQRDLSRRASCARRRFSAAPRRPGCAATGKSLWPNGE